MRISEYIKEYTAGRGIYGKDVWGEVKEFLVEVLKLNPEGMREEFGDVIHFLQLWLYSQCHIDGEIWKFSRHSVAKFINRKKVWQELYQYVGLDKNISGYVGNYKKLHKVIAHLSRFGIEAGEAELAYTMIVKNRP